MYHMGYHLEAQRQQRTIDRKKVAERDKTAPPQGKAARNIQEVRSGNRPVTRMTTAPPQSRANNVSKSGAKAQASTVVGYQRITQPTLEQRTFSPGEYEDRWLNNRFRIRHDRNLVPLPLRSVDVTHK